MVPAEYPNQAPVPPPAYHRTLSGALHLDALTLMSRLHLLELCALAVQVAQQRCPPPLPTGPGGAPRVSREEVLLLLALLRTMWRMSYQDLNGWLVAWPALALAYGLPTDATGWPCVPSASLQCRRAAQAGAPSVELLVVVMARLARRVRLIGGRDLLATAVRLYRLRPPVRLDAGYWSLHLIRWIHTTLGVDGVAPWNPKRQKNRSRLPPTRTADGPVTRLLRPVAYTKAPARHSSTAIARPAPGWH